MKRDSSASRLPTVGMLLLVFSGALAPGVVAAQDRLADRGETQFDPLFLRPSGGPVVPFFEGWYDRPDGTYELVFGYYNINTEEVLDIPLGPDNYIEPPELDGMQPTHFLTPPEGDRRHWGVFSVTVPADFGERDVVWTLRVRGEAYSVPGRLTSPPYELDGWEQRGRLNFAPTLRFTESGPEALGFEGIVSGPVTARVAHPLDVTVWARRDNPYQDDQRPVRVRWMHHQGTGNVEFREAETRVDAEGGPVANSVTFDRAGSYVLRILAYNSVTDFEFFCCWTNAYLRVDVAP